MSNPEENTPAMKSVAAEEISTKLSVDTQLGLLSDSMSESIQVEVVKKEANAVTGSYLDAASGSVGAAVGATNPVVKETINPLSAQGRKNAFAQLVKGWEAYMNDSEGDTFPSLKMLQSLQICGPTDVARIAGPLGSLNEMHRPGPGGLPLAPPALRHTHSSPLKYGPSILNHEQEEDIVPPPIPLDPFQRSSSTPSSFRQRSMNSAFNRIPSQRASYTSISRPGSHISAFDPVKYYASALEDMEQTSIEVTDTSSDTLQAESEKQKHMRGAASRAARFLSDVRVLRRRRRARNEKDLSSQSSSSKDKVLNSDGTGAYDTSVTVITEIVTNPNECSLHSQRSETSVIVKEPGGGDEKSEQLYGTLFAASDDEDEGEAPAQSTTHEEQQYQRLDSDGDEEELQFQRLNTTLQTESPGSVPSPSYEKIDDDRLKPPSNKISIHLPKENKAPDLARGFSSSSTPSPTGMTREGSTTPRSRDSASSPGSGTNSSGHTTQATFSSFGSGGLQSGLSTISETDREVMEANQEGKRRRKLDTLVRRSGGDGPKAEAEGGSLNSSSTNSTNPNGYLALENSPVSLREGANVPADRFFTNSPTTPVGRSSPSSRAQLPLNSRPNGQTSSPNTAETSSATHTSSSGGGSSCEQQEPPTFVSYLDRQGASDLTSTRDATEVPPARGDADAKEEREDSPAAELLGYSELVFEEANSTSREFSSPQPPSKIKRADRYRSRPPRSPTKGLRPLTTPPPRGSVSPMNQQSPPRNIVDQPTSSISRPNVMRTTPTPRQVLPEGGGRGSPVLLAPIPDSDDYENNSDGSPVNFEETGVDCRGSSGTVRGCTYKDGSVEIMKTSSKEEVIAANSPSPTLVTPEK